MATEKEPRKIKAYLSIGLVGCKRETVLEVEDEATDDEIDETVKDWADQRIEFGWKEAK